MTGAKSGPKLLLVEDEATIREALESSFRQAGFRVEAVPDGEGLDDRLARFRPDVVILDVMLPGRDGFQLASLVRRTGPTPILFLTAKDSVGDRLAGFERGADDYVIKPFATEELLARVRAVLRRSGRLAEEVVEVGDLVIEMDGARVVRAGEQLSLTATEFRVLAYLAANRGRVLSKTQILTQVWGYDAYAPNLVEVHIWGLRRKTEALGPRLIQTVRGVGYTLRC